MSISDGKLEDHGVLVLVWRQREAPLEPQRTHLGPPPEPEAHGGPQVLEGDGAVIREGVSCVEEDHAHDAHRLHDGDLQLNVEDELLVPADVERGERPAGIDARRDGRGGAQGVPLEAAHREDPADEEALEERRGGRDPPEGSVEAQDGVPDEGDVPAGVEQDPVIVGLAAEIGRRPLVGDRVVPALGGHQAVVPRVPGEAELQARRETVQLVAIDGHRREARPAAEIRGLVFELVGPEHEVVFEEAVSEGQVPADGVRRELLEDREHVVQVEGEGPVGVEEVGLHEGDHVDLPEAGDHRLEAEGLPPAQEVVLRQPPLEDERLQAAEAGADLQRAGVLLLDGDQEIHEVRVGHVHRHA
jgi:hypothetical protein